MSRRHPRRRDWPVPPGRPSGRVPSPLTCWAASSRPSVATLNKRQAGLGLSRNSPRTCRLSSLSKCRLHFSSGRPSNCSRRQPTKRTRASWAKLRALLAAATSSSPSSSSNSTRPAASEPTPGERRRGGASRAAPWAAIGDVRGGAGPVGSPCASLRSPGWAGPPPHARPGRRPPPPVITEGAAAAPAPVSPGLPRLLSELQRSRTELRRVFSSASRFQGNGGPAPAG